MACFHVFQVNKPLFIAITFSKTLICFDFITLNLTDIQYIESRLFCFFESLSNILCMHDAQ